MTLVTFPQQTQRTFAQSVDALRLEIACTQTVAEAWRIYEALKPLAQEMTQLVDAAADRLTALDREGL